MAIGEIQLLGAAEAVPHPPREPEFRRRPIGEMNEPLAPVDSGRLSVVECEGNRPMPGAATDIEAAAFPRPAKLVK